MHAIDPVQFDIDAGLSIVAGNWLLQLASAEMMITNVKFESD